jgi:hypothetical protein
MSAALAVAEPMVIESVQKLLSIDGGCREGAREGTEEYLDTKHMAIARS